MIICWVWTVTYNQANCIWSLLTAASLCAFCVIQSLAVQLCLVHYSLCSPAGLGCGEVFLSQAPKCWNYRHFPQASVCCERKWDLLSKDITRTQGRITNGSHCLECGLGSQTTSTLELVLLIFSTRCLLTSTIVPAGPVCWTISC